MKFNETTTNLNTIFLKNNSNKTSSELQLTKLKNLNNNLKKKIIKIQLKTTTTSGIIINIKNENIVYFFVK